MRGALVDRDREQPAVLLVDDDVELCQMMAEFPAIMGFVSRHFTMDGRGSVLH